MQRISQYHRRYENVWLSPTYVRSSINPYFSRFPTLSIHHSNFRTLSARQPIDQLKLGLQRTQHECFFTIDRNSDRSLNLSENKFLYNIEEQEKSSKILSQPLLFFSKIEKNKFEMIGSSITSKQESNCNRIRIRVIFPTS